MDYKLLVADLDGTFLNDSSEIPQENVWAVKTLIERGYSFAFASGRSFDSLDFFYNSLGLKGRGCYGMCFNGAFVYEVDTKRVVRKTLMENRIMCELVGRMRPFLKDIYVYDDMGTLYTEHETPTYVQYYSRSRVPNDLIERFETITKDVTKVLLIDDYEVLKRVYDALLPVTTMCNMFFSSRRMLEFTAPAATKGHALPFLGECMGVGIDSIAAVGDNFNDETMVAAAGLGIATQNAEEGVKKRAGYITEATNNDGAIKEIVERFFK